MDRVMVMDTDTDMDTDMDVDVDITSRYWVLFRSEERRVGKECPV